jgi:hypothetical protein
LARENGDRGRVGSGGIVEEKKLKSDMLAYGWGFVMGKLWVLVMRGLLSQR